MNGFKGCAILAGILYGIFVDGTFWKWYAAVVTCYMVFVLVQRNGKENPKRKTLLIGTWNCKCVFDQNLIVKNSISTSV